MTDIIPQARCKQCNELKDLTSENFYHPENMNVNSSTLCRKCKNARQRRRKTHPEEFVIPEGMKQCTHPDCKQWYPATLDYFPPEKRLRSGLSARCRICTKKYYQSYYPSYWDAHREGINAQSRRKRKENPERIRTYDNAHAALHQEAHRMQAHNQYQKNPEYYRIKTRVREGRKKELPGKFTPQDIQDQYKRQKGKCYYCHVKLNGKYEIEHIIPITREGSSNAPWNIVVTCVSCNRSKHNKLPHEWPRGSRLL